MPTQKPILISGGGLASLLLAQRLRRANIPIQIFERDPDMSRRGQGYRLRLSAQGLDAIESVLEGPDSPAWKEFWDACGKTAGAGVVEIDAITGERVEDESEGEGQAARASASASASAKKAEEEKDEKIQQSKTGGNGAPAANEKEVLTSRDGKTIGIARGDMRRLFLHGCEHLIQFGKHVTGYEHTPDKSGVRAIFADGSKSDEGSMLIGGEGIRSQVAQQLSKGKLKVYDTGSRGIHGQAPTTAFKGLGEGVFRIVDKSRTKGKVWIITNVRAGDMDDPKVSFGWTMGGNQGVIRAPNDDYAVVGKPAADIAKQLVQNWSPKIKSLFERMDESNAAFWKITCSTPSGVPGWDNDPRVTLIGDAVHSMTPAGGIGANTAVRDSELLGRLIVEAGGFGEGVTKRYEEEMRVYASEAVGISYGMASRTFGMEIVEGETATLF